MSFFTQRCFSCQHSLTLLCDETLEMSSQKRGVLLFDSMLSILNSGMLLRMVCEFVIPFAHPPVRYQVWECKEHTNTECSGIFTKLINDRYSPKKAKWSSEEPKPWGHNYWDINWDIFYVFESWPPSCGRAKDRAHCPVMIITRQTKIIHVTNNHEFEDTVLLSDLLKFHRINISQNNLQQGLLGGSAG